MVLLHMLCQLKAEFGWSLSVAHFNHRLRGRASEADEGFVRREASKLNLPCEVGRGDVRRRASRGKVSIEMAGRELRHAFFVRCARKRKARLVVLAQHADDQAELFLMRLVRGAGGAGLGGMRMKTSSPANAHITLLRPLLECPKSVLVEFAREYKIRFREDVSNQSDEFDRNWVRLKLLPLLRSRHDMVGQAISRSMRIAQAESDFARETAKRWRHGIRSGTGHDSFQKLHMAVQRQVIQEQLLEMGFEPDFQLIETLRLRLGKQVSVGRGNALVCQPDGVVRETKSEAIQFLGAETVVAIPAKRGGEPANGKVDFGGIGLKWRLLRRSEGFRLARRPGVEFFDAERVGARLLLRHWRPGDRFQPIGLPAATKLQDWFTNRKIPAAKRRQLVVAETERGEVFWVQGERIGAVAKITSATRRLLELRWKRS